MLTLCQVTTRPGALFVGAGGCIFSTDNAFVGSLVQVERRGNAVIRNEGVTLDPDSCTVGKDGAACSQSGVRMH